MSNEQVLITQAGLSNRVRKSRLPARLDLLQSITGLLLAIFLCGHLCFESSIIFGEKAMWHATKFFEGRYFFGKDYPIIISIIAAILFVLFVVHALLAMRKFPSSYRQYKVYCAHMRAMKHDDTSLWMWQVCTGFILFFFVSAHLYQMFFWPANIGPSQSGGRVWSDMMWPFYLILLASVVVHAGVGLYRLAVKWGWPNVPRQSLKKFRSVFIGAFLILGVVALGFYMKAGYDWKGKIYDPDLVIQETATEGSQQ